MHALAFERVEVGGKGGDERLALAGAHLGDLAVVQHDAADELHVEVAHANGALAGLAHDREGVGQNVIKRRAVLQLLLELGGHAFEVIVGERVYLVFKPVDTVHERADALEVALIGIAKHFGQETHAVRCSLVSLCTLHAGAMHCL
jgi:hypothetical protein